MDRVKYEHIMEVFDPIKPENNLASISNLDLAGVLEEIGERRIKITSGVQDSRVEISTTRWGKDKRKIKNRRGKNGWRGIRR